VAGSPNSFSTILLAIKKSLFYATTILCPPRQLPNQLAAGVAVTVVEATGLPMTWKFPKYCHGLLCESPTANTSSSRSATTAATSSSAASTTYATTSTIPANAVFTAGEVD
jgi:hypothetical protein